MAVAMAMAMADWTRVGEERACPRRAASQTSAVHKASGPNSDVARPCRPATSDSDSRRRA